ncbi:MAG: sugar phosphate nucleotidyltransferase [Nanoarchaeota archaeon]
MVDKNNIPVVILCGGKGTRLREETETIPKPMVLIGGKPILWHIMKIYSHYGFNKFFLLLGYKGEKIKSYFLEYPWENHDFNIKTKNREIASLSNEDIEDWEISLLDTGLDSLTGRRLFLIKNLLKDYDNFMLTYGDGVSDVNLNELLNFHLSRNNLITITGVHSKSKQGKINHENGLISDFKEKPVLHDLFNGGFMVFNKEALSYISEENTMLEYDLIPKLVIQRKVGLYQHNGFWQSMDTFQDKELLEDLWKENPYWRIWNENCKG